MDKLPEIPEQKWNEELENLMKAWGEKAAGNKELHLMSARKWQMFSNRMYTPLLLLNTIGGVGSIGSTGSTNNHYIMICIGIMNIASAVLTGLVKYHRVEEKIQEHLFTSKAFGSFYRTISLELALSKDTRKDADVFNLWAKNEYDKMLKEAPMVSQYIIDEYKAKHENDLNKPDIVSDSYVINIHGRKENFKEN